MSGVLPSSAIHLHVYIVDDIEEVLHNGDSFVSLLFKFARNTASLKRIKENVYVMVISLVYTAFTYLNRTGSQK